MKGYLSAYSGQDWLPTFSRVASALVIFIALLVLAGWVFGVSALITLFPGNAPMNPVAAVTFILAGVSLCRFANRAKELSHRIDILALLFAVVVTLVGAVRLADYVMGFDFPFEHLLSSARVNVNGAFPSKEMAPNAALNFFLCGLALVLFDVEIRPHFRVAQVLILIAGFITLLALIGYTYRVVSLYQVGTAVPMSLASAVAFALFCLGFLAARPRRGLMTVVTSGTTGGAVARRLLPMAVLIPWALGALLLVGEQARYYEHPFAVSIFAILSIVIFTALIWWNAKLLYSADVERVKNERRLAVQHNATRIVAESRTLKEATPRILQTICETLGWHLGMMWLVDNHANIARCFEVWAAPSAELNAFVEDSRKTTFPRGEGLPGRVWATDQSIWVPDVTKGNDRLAFPAAKAGLQGAFAFPIRLGQEMLGVMEFFSQQVEPPDPTLLEMLGAVGSQIGLFVERTRAEEQLRLASANLERSNTDLQQFAYVASHDLFEPLRMVISYLQLLIQRYQGQLDKQAQEFIGFALDGAQRMQALIHDLLAYSRVDIRGRSMEPTESEQIVKAAIANLKVAIEETGATIAREPLPKVRADAVQLTQVFQNLIGNALKFHGAESPRIEVGAHLRDGEWLFFVRDNGIGIDPKNFDRIFVIFQRLHTRHEYSGTGMGLAICKKIIERHGGCIWVESALSKGSTFYFTLPRLDESQA